MLFKSSKHLINSLHQHKCEEKLWKLGKSITKVFFIFAAANVCSARQIENLLSMENSAPKYLQTFSPSSVGKQLRTSTKVRSERIGITLMNVFHALELGNCEEERGKVFPSAQARWEKFIARFMTRLMMGNLKCAWMIRKAENWNEPTQYDWEDTEGRLSFWKWKTCKENFCSSGLACVKFHRSKLRKTLLGSFKAAAVCCLSRYILPYCNLTFVPPTVTV